MYPWWPLIWPWCLFKVIGQDSRSFNFDSAFKKMVGSWLRDHMTGPHTLISRDSDLIWPDMSTKKGQTREAVVYLGPTTWGVTNTVTQQHAWFTCGSLSTGWGGGVDRTGLFAPLIQIQFIVDDHSSLSTFSTAYIIYVYKQTNIPGKALPIFKFPQTAPKHDTYRPLYEGKW